MRTRLSGLRYAKGGVVGDGGTGEAEGELEKGRGEGDQRRWEVAGRWRCQDSASKNCEALGGTCKLREASCW